MTGHFGNKIRICAYLAAIVGLYFLTSQINHFLGEGQKRTESMGGAVAVSSGEETPFSQTEAEQKKVALTFDDGPGPYTERLLDGLKERNVQATFFVLGEKAELCPETIQRMHEEGHVIGNHTYSHTQLNVISCEQALEEVERTNQVIERLTGERPDLLRPPYGECRDMMKKNLDMVITLWDVDPLDWCTLHSDIVAKRVIEDVKENDIILLHDIYETSVDAALEIVDELTEQNYKFVTVDELLFP